MIVIKEFINTFWSVLATEFFIIFSEILVSVS